MSRGKINFLFILSFILLGLFLFSNNTCADGMAHAPISKMGGEWKLLNENGQMCFINHQAGTEKMIVAIGLENIQGEKASWIFPVPSQPKKTEIEISEGFPMLDGQNLKETYGNYVQDFTIGAIGISQLYALPLMALNDLKGGRALEGRSWEGGGVEIHEHIERAGLTTELITARESSALYNYFEKKNISLPADSERILEEYIGKDYSFVASWVSDFEKFRSQSKERHHYIIENPLGVEISFPTEKLYYPLKPTSVYGSNEIPIKIYTRGWLKPDLYSEITDETEVSYYSQNYYKVPKELRSFFNGKDHLEDLKYTKIEINSEARKLKKDLWIKKETADKPLILNSLINYFWVLGLIIFVISSCLASLFAGKVISREKKISNRGFTLFGLTNFLSLVGLVLIFHFGKIDKRLTESERKIDTLGFIFTFSVLFVIFMFLFSFIIYIVPVILI
ncbi:MAG: hypothetical protein ABEK17_01620 [Candidatus Aenigmatarchaeota archaeon]